MKELSWLPPVLWLLAGVGVGLALERLLRPWLARSARSTRWKIDDVLGVWPLHGLCGLWGGIACGIFGLKALGGLGGITFGSQLVGSLMGAAAGYVSGYIIYLLVDKLFGFRMSPDDERIGADLAIHKISANPEGEMTSRVGV